MPSEEHTARVRQLKRRDTITVERDGEQIEVYNWCTVDECHRVRPGETETFEPRVWAGDAIGVEPDAITHWLARYLTEAVDIRVSRLDVEVINPTKDGVTVV